MKTIKSLLFDGRFILGNTLLTLSMIVEVYFLDSSGNSLAAAMVVILSNLPFTYMLIGAETDRINAPDFEPRVRIQYKSSTLLSLC